jgi:plastocyanin
MNLACGATGADAFSGFRFAKLVSKYSVQTKTIMKKILLLAALLIGSVSAAWSADHPVTVSNFVFTPSTVNAVVGDTISWTWVNGMHTTTAVSIPQGARRWNKPIDVNRLRFRMRVTVAGTYNYRCNFHFAQGMTGTIVVSAASPGQVPATN